MRVGGFQSGFHARVVSRDQCKWPEYLICSHDCQRIIQLVSHVSGEVEFELCLIEAERMARVLLCAAEKARREVRWTMAVKHTPGPWRLNRRFCFNVEDENGRTVARVNSEPKTYDEALANARLIAAAPDLLAAAEAGLKRLQAIITDPDVPDYIKFDGVTHMVMDDMRYAIAKARGEEES